MKLWHLCSLVMIAATQLAPNAPAAPAAPTTVLASRVVDWDSMESTATRTGQRRMVFDAPTDTLDKLHLHITTLNPGENTGPLHRHPQEEMVIIKEGTIEVNIDGRKQTAGPGSVIYFSVNENENMTNVGKTPATYHVIQWFTPRTPKP
jgi:XRE family transcriptional regulator, regulator of sulfur utilization